MRGAHEVTVQVTRLGGIIPAYAGSTDYRRIDRKRWWDHPRVCGEHFSLLSSRMARKGSSPRMRGARGNRLYLPLRHRIIPAYAGSTLSSCLVAELIRDHPRVCGEHRQTIGRTPETSGSSPRMRGALEPVQRVPSVPGIIPAYAGSTCRGCSALTG